MAEYTNHADGSSSVNSEQIENNTGNQYRASGNLFIVRQTSKTIPTSYTGCRGSVVSFSASSGVRMRRYLRECRPEYRYMVTLTYPYEFPSNGTESKNHLRKFLQEVQREYARGHRLPNGKIQHGTGENYSGLKQLHSAFWFLEFQERGAPHYHIFLNWAPSKDWVSKRWYEIVNSEDIRHFHAGTRTEKLHSGRSGTISYASKYAAKLEQKVVPKDYENVGRFWGVYGDRVTVSAATFVSRSDSKVPHIKRSLEHLLLNVKEAIAQGKAEVIRREEGLLLVSVNDAKKMQMIRHYLGTLACHVYGDTHYLYDAELEYGAIYDG